MIARSSFATDGAAALPVIAVTGMAFEARIARGNGVEAVYAARADLLERALTEAVARGCSGIISFGTAGGLAPDLAPGTLIVADALDGPFGRISTDARWSERIAGALAVDMESHIAGAMAGAHGLPFAVCPAILDPAWRTLPSASTAGLRDDCSTALAPILRELLKHPSQIGPLIQLAADARAARASLVDARRVLEEAAALRIA